MQERYREATRAAWLGLGINVGLGAAKLAGGLIGGSFALVADAVNSLGDGLTSLVVLIGLRISQFPPDPEHPYGHTKAEYFSSGAEGVLICAAAIWIIWAALHRFFHPAALQQLGWSLVISSIASVLNFITSRVLLAAGRRHDSIVLEADAHHLMTDVWTSVGVAAGLVLVLWMPAMSWLDPVIAMAVGANILVTAYRLLRRSADGLMDTALPDSEVAVLRGAVETALAGRGTLIGLRSRKSGAQRFADVDVTLPAQMTVGESHRICDEVETAIRAAFSPAPQATVHVEPDQGAS